MFDISLFKKHSRTLSPMTSTQSQGKNPTSKPRFPRHQIDSSGPGMSITEIMSPTCKNETLDICIHVMIQKVNITLRILYEHEHGTPNMCFQGNCSHFCTSSKYTDVVLYCYAMLQNGSTVLPSFAHGLKGGGSVMTVISISTLLVPVGSTIENC